MAATPEWKVYRAKEYVAAFKYAEDAAVFSGAAGGEVRHGHGLVVWREGLEDFSAAESYDRAAQIMEQRRQQHFIKVYNQVHGEGAAERILNQGAKEHANG